MWTITLTGMQPVVTDTGEELTSGSANIPIKFFFDEAWAAMQKTIVYRNHAPQVVRVDSCVDEVIGSGAAEYETVISKTALINPGELLIGIFGVLPDQSIASVYCAPIKVSLGATPSGEEIDTSDPLYVQLMHRLQQIPTNGRGIVSISKTSTEGLIDTYTISYSDGAKSTFEVKNGADGEDAVGAASAEDVNALIDAINNVLDTVIGGAADEPA